MPSHYQHTDEVVRLHGAVCHLCRRPIDMAARNSPYTLQIDHVWPRSRGGCDHLANLRPSHRRCNGSRGNRILPSAPRPICPCAAAARARTPQPAALPTKRVRAGKVRRVAGHVVLWLLALNPVLVAATIATPPSAVLTVPWALLWLWVVRRLWFARVPLTDPRPAYVPRRRRTKPEPAPADGPVPGAVPGAVPAFLPQQRVRSPYVPTGSVVEVARATRLRADGVRGSLARAESIRPHLGREADPELVGRFQGIINDALQACVRDVAATRAAVELWVPDRATRYAFDEAAATLEARLQVVRETGHGEIGDLLDSLRGIGAAWEPMHRAALALLTTAAPGTAPAGPVRVGGRAS